MAPMNFDPLISPLRCSLCGLELTADEREAHRVGRLPSRTLSRFRESPGPDCFACLTQEAEDEASARGEILPYPHPVYGGLF